MCYKKREKELLCKNRNKILENYIRKRALHVKRCYKVQSLTMVSPPIKAGLKPLTLLISRYKNARFRILLMSFNSTPIFKYFSARNTSFFTSFVPTAKYEP